MKQVDLIYLKTPELISKLGSDITRGLSQEDAEKRLRTGGENVLEANSKSSFLKKFIRQISDKMVIILLIAALISAINSFLSGDGYVDSILILFIVMFNAFVGVIQENKAEKAIEALSKMSAPVVRVLREGKIFEISSRKIVPGDIIYLDYGTVVPADARLLKENELLIDESSLTGESAEVRKSVCIIKENAHITEMKNTVFASTSVKSGSGIAMVLATGMNTYIGSVAKLIDNSQSPQTPLQKRLSKTSVMLGNFALGICILVFIVGLIRQQPGREMFLTSVSLAVAAIPEGLPAIITIILSIGVRRMAQKNAIVRKLSAVETLGSATIICSDKTGTLTQNRMTVTDVIGDKPRMMELGLLCNNNINPTDRAIYDYCIQNTNPTASERVKELPFNSDRKIMTVVVKQGNNYLTVTKGAPDIVTHHCAAVPANIEKSIKEMTSKALRVIAVACKESKQYPSEIESGLSFIGLFGLSDPARPEVKSSVRTCIQAGIKPVMITGDFIETAIAIAKDTDIYNGVAVTQKQLEAMNEREQNEKILAASVFARTSPSFKLKIIETLQSKGNIVAMTGDGVNDAPALKKADIGCSMGSGTSVARESSDMILTDDNFTTVVEAVGCGRGIFDDLKKAVHFLLSCNIGELFTVFAAILAGFPSPLNAIQLLWVNLVTDSLPAVALGMEKPEKDIMKRKPPKHTANILDAKILRRITIEGVFIGLLSLCAFFIGMLVYEDKIVASTMTFAVLSLSQLFHSFNMKSEKVFLLSRPLNNFVLLLSFVLCTILMVLVIQIPVLAALFSAIPLTNEQWLTVAALSAAPIIFCDLLKLFTKRLY